MRTVLFLLLPNPVAGLWVETQSTDVLLMEALPLPRIDVNNGSKPCDGLDEKLIVLHITLLCSADRHLVHVAADLGTVCMKLL